MNTLKVGQKMSVAMSASNESRHFTILAIGPKMVDVEYRVGAVRGQLSRSTLERGLRHARIEEDPDGSKPECVTGKDITQIQARMRALLNELRASGVVKSQADAVRILTEKGCRPWQIARILKCARAEVTGCT